MRGFPLAACLTSASPSVCTGWSFVPSLPSLPCADTKIATESSMHFVLSKGSLSGSHPSGQVIPLSLPASPMMLSQPAAVKVHASDVSHATNTVAAVPPTATNDAATNQALMTTLSLRKAILKSRVVRG